MRLNGIYEIESLIAHGGMGEVYRGFNIQTRDPVAIKMIRPEFSNDPEIFELFRREASILHSLAHEAIVRYFVFSIDPELRRAYLATEFVDGESLTKRISSGPLPLADVRTLQKRVGLALDAAHRYGVVHRDISPDNIILPGDDVRNAKVIDFGIARSVRRTEVSIIGGRFAGKYNYASPEQFGLAGGEVTFKSDIYSFGLVLAAALRGRPIDMSGSEVEAIAKRRVAPDLSSIDPTIRPLIQQMLRPLPADRPESMAAVAAWESREEVLAASRARRAQGAGPSGSGRAAALFGAVIALGSVGGTAYFLRDDLAQWGRSVVARAPTGAGKPPSVSETPVKALPPLKQREPTPTAPPLTEQSTSPAPPPAAPAPPPAEQPQPAIVASAPPPATPPSAPVAHTETPVAAPPAPSPEASASATRPEPAPPPAPNASAEHAPGSAEIADTLAAGLAPRAPQDIKLPAATMGEHYRAGLPPFEDRSGKGLRLTANRLPEGMTFSDLGQGKGQIEGAPTRAGSATMQIVATDNHNGKTAEMSATIVVAERAKPKATETPIAPIAPPVQPAPHKPNIEFAPAAQALSSENSPIARIEQAPALTAPVDETARRAPEPDKAPAPQISGSDSGQPARIEPPPAPADESASPAPTRPDAASNPQPDAADNGPVARIEPSPAAAPINSSAPKPEAGPALQTPAQTPSSDSGPMAQLAPHAETAPADSQPPAVDSGPVARLEPPPAAPLSPVERGRAFAAAFDGGDCFLVKPRPGADRPHAYEVVGRELEPFLRFDAAYKSEVGVEADLRGARITADQCPALDLIRLGAEGETPLIELDQYDIGRGKPLAGTISNLNGRRLYLVLVDNDGVVHRLDAKTQQGGGAATFSIRAAPRGDSIGPMQMLLAIASDSPISTLETLRPTSLKSIAPLLVDEARRSSASVEADYFKFVN